MANRIKPEIHSISLGGNESFLTGSSASYRTAYDGLAPAILSIMNIKKPLHVGSIYIESDGYLNMRNPACYVYPKENDCEPGDRFRGSQKEDLKNFASYKPYAFKVSIYQKIANHTSVLAFLICILYLALLLVWLCCTLQSQSLKKNLYSPSPHIITSINKGFLWRTHGKKQNQLEKI